MMTLSTLWTQPVLPAAFFLPLSVALSWAGVAAAGLWWAARVNDWPWLRKVAVVVMLSALLPWTRGWTADLALAFQTPSLLTLLWCGVYAAGCPHAAPGVKTPQPAHDAMPGVLSLLGVLLGWGLWIDTFNHWPVGWDVSLYAWGFEAATLWLIVVALWAWMALTPRTASPTTELTAKHLVQQLLTQARGVVLLALVLFALTRWPTGNVWDALLDPWLWLLCHVRWARYIARRSRHQ